MTGRALSSVLAMRLPLATLAAFSLALSPATAGILEGQILQQSGNGAVVYLDPPPGLAVGADTFDDENLYAFAEVRAVRLGHDIAIEIGAPDGVIAAGTVIDSHYVFFDSLDGAHFATLLFETPILGVATTPESLAATDAYGRLGVVYLAPRLRGLETGDEVWIDEDDPRRLFLLWAGSSPGDYIRVFTAAAYAPLMM